MPTVVIPNSDPWSPWWTTRVLVHGWISSNPWKSLGKMCWTEYFHALLIVSIVINIPWFVCTCGSCSCYRRSTPENFVKGSETKIAGNHWSAVSVLLEYPHLDEGLVGPRQNISSVTVFVTFMICLIYTCPSLGRLGGFRNWSGKLENLLNSFYCCCCWCLLLTGISSSPLQGKWQWEAGEGQFPDS